MSVPALDPVAARHADRLTFVDGLRAVAVVWVMLHHLAHGGHMPHLLRLLPQPLITVTMDWGYLGVTIFFVLSGYVMALTMHQHDVDHGVAGRFLLRRLRRLTPPYLVALAVAVALDFVALRVQPGHDVPSVGSIVAHAFYAQHLLGYPPINDIYWTLAIEIQFYVAFALMMLGADALRRRTGWRHARIAMAAVSAAAALPWAWHVLVTPIWPGGFIGFWYRFMLGVLACMVALRVAGAGWVLAALAVLLALPVGSGLTPSHVVALATTGALVAAHRAGAMDRWLGSRWVQFIGLTSYSLYLLHLDVQGAVGFVLRRVLPETLVTDVIVIVTILAATLLASWLVFRWIERPSIHWSRQLRLARRPRDAGTAANDGRLARRMPSGRPGP